MRLIRRLERHRNQDPSVEDNALVAAARRKLPITDTYDHGRIVTRRHGRRAFTPLLLTLLAIGTTDLLFAFDSIPAVFGVTDHAYIVFAANAFALLGLRALYFLLADLLGRLIYLSTGLAAILAFIGAKLVLEFAHQQHHSIPEIPTGPSLALIAAVLAATTVASLESRPNAIRALTPRRELLRQPHLDARPTTRLPTRTARLVTPARVSRQVPWTSDPSPTKRHRGTFDRLVGKPRIGQVPGGRCGVHTGTDIGQNFDKMGRVARLVQVCRSSVESVI